MDYDKRLLNNFSIFLKLVFDWSLELIEKLNFQNSRFRL